MTELLGAAAAVGLAVAATATALVATVAPDPWDAPCRHWTGAAHCGATPTRLYQRGRRCQSHASPTRRPHTDP